MVFARWHALWHAPFRACRVAKADPVVFPAIAPKPLTGRPTPVNHPLHTGNPAAAGAALSGVGAGAGRDGERERLRQQREAQIASQVEARRRAAR
jgi:hypothetical protein